MNGGVLGSDNAGSSIMIWIKEFSIARSQISNRQMQCAYTGQAQDYVPDYKGQRSEMVTVEQVFGKCFVLLLGLKNYCYACEDGT